MKATLDEKFLRAASLELAKEGTDGWLLFDLEARNRIAAELLGIPDGTSRRIFVLVRPDEPPVALAHRMELQHWQEWEGEVEAYVGWREMETALADMLAGCGSVAMEVSDRDAVPFVDQVPAGVVELIEGFGVEVRSSAALLTKTYAQWGEIGYETHMRASRDLAEIAQAAFEKAYEAASGGGELTEYQLGVWIREQIASRGLSEQDCIVACGANSDSGHYTPLEGESGVLGPDDVLLIDLWGRVEGEPDAVFADQTWMGVLGPGGPEEFQAVWDAVASARDGAVELIRDRIGAGGLTGAEVDREARTILEDAGFGEYIQHRLGHGMDRALHGFGPNLDSEETREDRELLPGIGFSVEPGLYLPNRFGIRSEINVYLREDGPEVTTPGVQSEPWRP